MGLTSAYNRRQSVADSAVNSELRGLAASVRRHDGTSIVQFDAFNTTRPNQNH
jgi:hypothetical protein